MFKDYREVENAMNRLVEDEFLGGVFLRTLASGGYSMPQIRYFAVQYSYYSRHFPRVLGAAISAMAPLDSWWIPLADNLWDEAGRGAPGKSHAHLYKTFLFSAAPEVELDEHGVPRDAMSPAVAEAIQTFIDFFQQATPLEAMAAVGLGSEMFAGTVMGAIADGLRHPLYNEKPLNLLFWDVHADEHEPRHYQLCKDILIQFDTQANLESLYLVGSRIAQSEALMYARLHAEMLALTNAHGTTGD